tara:strand:- start:22 stop:507 length:486 start_codon:yes stop_codon:yes gene_type:complete
MIITCPKCKKKFNIDPTLIHDDGRDLQCGSCNHVWFYKAEDEREAPLTLNENISKNKLELDTEIKEKSLIFSKKLHQEKRIKPETKKEILKETSETITKSANSASKFFSYLIVFIISSVALIILLDTLKTPLINVFPGLESILFNLFETLQDIQLFIIDLI